MEFFPEDGNYIYTIAQFFPRMCVYDDYQGWQNKQYLGKGEFALPFGDYKVRITTPADHIVAATGTLQNAKEVLSKTGIRVVLKKQRWRTTNPLLSSLRRKLIRRKKQNQRKKRRGNFMLKMLGISHSASSRKFIWDAQAVKLGSKTPLAMSYYPKEGESALGEGINKSSEEYTGSLFEIYNGLSLSGCHLLFIRQALEWNTR